MQSISPEPTPMRAGRTSESASPQQTDKQVHPHGHERDSPQNGTGQPGDKQLEGPQNAQLVLQKTAPPEIQVGRPAVLRTTVTMAAPRRPPMSKSTTRFPWHAALGHGAAGLARP